MKQEKESEEKSNKSKKNRRIRYLSIIINKKAVGLMAQLSAG